MLVSQIVIRIASPDCLLQIIILHSSYKYTIPRTHLLITSQTLVSASSRGWIYPPLDSQVPTATAAMNFTTNTTMISANSTLNGYHQAPVSETPLSELVRQGLVVMGVNGLASTISTFSLLAFMTHRMIYWKRYYEEPLAKNQVLLLMFNLIIADFQQSLAFVISFYWLHRNEIVSSHPMCQAQGWFLQIGDVSSGFWVVRIISISSLHFSPSSPPLLLSS